MFVVDYWFGEWLGNEIIVCVEFGCIKLSCGCVVFVECVV